MEAQLVRLAIRYTRQVKNMRACEEARYWLWEHILVVAVTPQDSKLDETQRFPVCQPEPLVSLFRSAGLKKVSVRAIEIFTVFNGFEDYWAPFLGKQGPTPTYLASVDDEVRGRIRELLRERLPIGRYGTIELTARAWAVQGVV